MGQVIELTVLQSRYPATTADLDPVESVLLLAIRWWVADYREGDDPLPRLCEGMGHAGAHDAAFSVDRLMQVVAKTARHPIAIHCPRCPNLSGDETQLLHAASLAQSGESDRAERALRTALLSAQGAEFALGPLEGLGELLAEAKLRFRRRRSPEMEARPPAAASNLIH